MATKIKMSRDDRIMYTIFYIVFAFLIVVMAYPIIYVVSASFSDPVAVSTGKVVLFPVNASLDGYKAVFTHKRILLGYRNTIFYTVIGTAIQLAVTMMAAYPLSRPDLMYKKFYMKLFTIAMFFSGGMIPSYLLIVNIGWYNTIWPLLIPGAVSVYRIIVAKTFIQNTIPNELLEAAQIDGCSDSRYFFSIVLPLSKAVMAVSVLFFAIGHWNSYFSAFIYLRDHDLQPLQLVLREVLINNTVNVHEMQNQEELLAKQGMSDLLKYSLIVVSTAPIIALYPFVQKYFIKGMMIGSLKG